MKNVNSKTTTVHMMPFEWPRCCCLWALLWQDSQLHATNVHLIVFS